jgi:serine/threonine protein kinase
MTSIKGANILVDNKGYIKLADFGASEKVVKLATISEAKSMKGTPYWMSFVRRFVTGKLICGVLAAL